MKNIIIATISACALLIVVTAESKAACDDRYINTCGILSWHWSKDKKKSEFRASRKWLKAHHHSAVRMRERIARAAVQGAQVGGQVAAIPASQSRPSDCYGIAWCGCWLRHFFGLASRSLNLAANWAHIGSPASADSANVVVWRHHVGRLLAHNGDRILVQSGNDRGAVRTRWLSPRILGGVIAWRRV